MFAAIAWCRSGWPKPRGQRPVGRRHWRRAGWPGRRADAARAAHGGQETGDNRAPTRAAARGGRDHRGRQNNVDIGRHVPQHDQRHVERPGDRQQLRTGDEDDGRQHQKDEVSTLDPAKHIAGDRHRAIQPPCDRRLGENCITMIVYTSNPVSIIPFLGRQASNLRGFRCAL